MNLISKISGTPITGIHRGKHYTSVVLLLFFMLMGSSVSQAAARYWVGGSGANWNTTGSWSTSSGGASGASVPSTNDTAIFNGSGTNNCSIDVNVSVNRIRMASGYTGTISQNGYTVTTGSGGFIVTDGTFTGSSSNITLSGTLTINGGTFISTSGTLSTTSGITFSSGTFTHNSGTVELKATATLSGSPTFYNFSIAPTAANTTITVSNSPIVSHTFTVGGTKNVTINTGTIDVDGDISISNNQTGGGGTGTISITGSGTQILDGRTTAGQGVLPNITVNKSSSDTLRLDSVIAFGGNWTQTAGIIAAGSSTLYINSSSSFLSNSFSINNLIMKSGASMAAASGVTITVLGDFTGYSSYTGGTGYFDMKGDLTINSTGTLSSYTGNIRINGNGNQTITGSSSAFNGYLPNIRIGKHPADTLFLVGTITQTGTWDLDSGVVSAGTSTMCINNTDVYGTQNWNNLIIASGSSSNIASTDTLRVLGNLTFNTTGSVVALGGGTMHVKGNITMQHTAANTSTQSCTLVINGTGTQTLTGNGTAGTGMFCNIVIDKPATDTLYLSSIISVRGNWTYKRGIVNATTHAAGVAFYGSNTVDAQGTAGNVMSFYNVQVYSGTVTLAGSLRTVNNFQINGSSTCAPGSNTIYVGGTWNNNGTFSASTSTVAFEGSGYRAIKKASTALETFYNLTLNRTFEAGSALLLNTPIKVTNTLTLTRGKIKANRTGGTPFYFELADNATVSGGGDSAFVYGPLRKTGNDTFSFPLGDTLATVGAFHPIKISAPSSTTDQFEAEYIGKTADSSGYSTSSFDTTLASVSTCGFWKLQRKAGSSNVVATISANINSTCDDPDINEMRIAAWDTTGTDRWRDLGDSNRSVFNNLVSVSSTSSITLPMTTNPIPIANAKKANNTVYATLRKKLDGGYFQITNAQLYFRYDEEYNDTDGKLTFNVYNDDHEKITSNTIISPTSLIPAIAYGDNRCHLNMFGCYVLNGGGFLTDGFYILEVINEKNEKWYLRFQNTNGIALPACSNTWGS